MPRTKRTSKTTKSSSNVSNADKLARKKAVDAYLKDFDGNCEFKMQLLTSARDNTLRKLDIMKTECKRLVSTRIGNTPYEDLDKVLSESTHFITVSDITSNSNLFELTNTLKTVRTRKNKRSSSLVNDEGYLTAENSESSGGKRTSRAEMKKQKTTRVSRSLSRSKVPQTSSVISNYKTPQNKQPKNDFGFVTPKVKPNTPQVILRRPKEGELAISMQGSPLMVNTIVSHEANVNIPLGDGRTISIQPKLGLRMSQLPDIDRSIKRQIEVLRDNLIKVCEMSK